MVVATEKDSILGVGRLSEEEDVLVLGGMRVLEKHRGRGIGTAGCTYQRNRRLYLLLCPICPSTTFLSAGGLSSGAGVIRATVSEGASSELSRGRTGCYSDEKREE